ncbi:kinase-like domain-containing protein, partial [Crepidotus variabilis]
MEPQPMSLLGFPGIRDEDGLIVQDHTQGSLREFTVHKLLNNGLNRVMLCDWHSALPSPITFPEFPSLHASKHGFGDWQRVVVTKRLSHLTKPVESIEELKILKSLPPHPNVISLYDYFTVTPENPVAQAMWQYELYIVMEAMEGHLYHFLRTRRPSNAPHRPFTAGLVSSIFHQIVSGIQHIHSNGFFHRDIIPENILVTTTGLGHYLEPSNRTETSKMHTDVIATLKLADFGIARPISSEPPYTEYVTTRWYRSPEVLLFARHYTPAVDMWAIGAVMAEVVNLQPLFPGIDQVDQLTNVVTVLGTPGKGGEHAEGDEVTRPRQIYDLRGFPVGGGPWPDGWKLVADVGTTFPQVLVHTSCISSL